MKIYEPCHEPCQENPALRCSPPRQFATVSDHSRARARFGANCEIRSYGETVLSFGVSAREPVGAPEPVLRSECRGVGGI